jgi:hypothetical protein
MVEPFSLDGIDIKPKELNEKRVITPRNREPRPVPPLVPTVVVTTVSIDETDDLCQSDRQNEVYRLWSDEKRSVEQIRNVIVSYRDEYLPDKVTYTTTDVRNDLSSVLRARLRDDEKALAKDFVHIELSKLDEDEMNNRRLMNKVNGRLMNVLAVADLTDRDENNEFKALWSVYSSLQIAITRSMERRSKYLALDTAPTPAPPPLQQNNITLTLEDFTNERNRLVSQGLLSAPNQIDDFGTSVEADFVDGVCVATES